MCYVKLIEGAIKLSGDTSLRQENVSLLSVLFIVRLSVF